ncbi:MAG: alpha/beta hydrolase, partial [Acidimicrobiia bacterium]
LTLDPKVVAGFGLILVPGLAKAAVAGRRTGMTPEESVRLTLDLCTPHPERLSPEVFEAHVDLTRRRAEMGGWDESFIEATRTLIAMLLRRFSYDRMISQIPAPALVVQGRQDRLVSHQAVQRVGCLRPDWEIRILEDVGHIAMLEVPRTFTDLVRGWLVRAAAA